MRPVSGKNLLYKRTEHDTSPGTGRPYNPRPAPFHSVGFWHLCLVLSSLLCAPASGEPWCPVAAFEISPLADIQVPAGETASVLLTAELQWSAQDPCDPGTVQVEYRLNGSLLGASQDAAGGFPIIADGLPVGVHAVSATATILETGERAQDTEDFNVRNRPPLVFCYADPLACLTNDGDVLFLTEAGIECNVSRGMTTWFHHQDPLSGDSEISVTLANPANPEQVVVLRCLRPLLGDNYQAVLVVTLACTINELLGPEEATRVAPTPETLLPGAPFFDVSVLVRESVTGTFREIDGFSLLSYPVEIMLMGVAPAPEGHLTFLSHPSQLRVLPGGGLALETEPGTWQRDALFDVFSGPNGLTGRASALSLFAVAEAPVDPKLAVYPGQSEPVAFGPVEAGHMAERVLLLKNVGTGALEGKAALADPSGTFSLLGKDEYILGDNGSVWLWIRFNPTKAGAYSASLTLSGETAGVVTLDLSGTGLPTGTKPLLTCGAGNPSHGSPAWGDGLMLLFTVGMLTAGNALRRLRSG